MAEWLDCPPPAELECITRPIEGTDDRLRLWPELDGDRNDRDEEKPGKLERWRELDEPLNDRPPLEKLRTDEPLRDEPLREKLWLRDDRLPPLHEPPERLPERLLE